MQGESNATARLLLDRLHREAAVNDHGNSILFPD
jgi:hypothetical protein